MNKKVYILIVVLCFVITTIITLNEYPPLSGKQINLSYFSTICNDKININTAIAEELTLLKGIGSVKAQAIVDYRENHGNFLKTEDLMKVKGITEKIFNEIKEDIEV